VADQQDLRPGYIVRDRHGRQGIVVDVSDGPAYRGHAWVTVYVYEHLASDLILEKRAWYAGTREMMMRLRLTFSPALARVMSYPEKERRDMVGSALMAVAKRLRGCSSRGQALWQIADEYAALADAFVPAEAPALRSVATR
jgi:hypothetical protein